MVSSVETQDYSASFDNMDQMQWSAILENFADASIFQTWEYGAVRWGEKNLSHMVLKKGSTIISAAQIRILSVPLIRRGMAYIFYGPMWRIYGAPRNIAYFQLGLQALIDEYAIKRGLFIRLRPWGFIEKDSDIESTTINEGFTLTRGIFKVRKRTILVDLHPTEDELRKGLKKKWRQTLQRSERENLEIVEGFDSRLFEFFKCLFFETIRIKKFTPGADVNEFARIQKKLLPNQRMRITICNAKGVYVSSSVCSAIGDVVIGLLSATGDLGRRVQAYYLLQWDEILWAKKMGKSYYELGGIDPETNPGVYRFKSGLGGQEVTLLGVYDFCTNRIFYHATLAFERALHLRYRLKNYKHAFHKRR